MASAYPAALDSFSTAFTDASIMATAHAQAHDDERDAINKIEAELGLTPKGVYASVRARLDALNLKIFNVEDGQYGAVDDDFYQDGVATSASTTFTSAAANFTAADVGKTIVILRAGASSAQDHHTTIAGFTNSTTVTLTNAAGRSQSPARFYISRGGDQTTAIQAAIDAAAAAGGGIVYCPGAGYLVSGLTLKNRVTLVGAGMLATMVHLIAGSAKSVIAVDTTSGNSASVCAIRDMWIDGNRGRATDVSTTLTASYTAGSSTTLSLTSVAGLPPSGIVTINAVKYLYTAISGSQLTGVTGGVGGTTDTSQPSGSAISWKPGGVYLAKNPYNAGGSAEDTFDAHHLVENVHIKNVRGTGLEMWGQSESRAHNVWVKYADEYGFKPSYDSWLSDCTADTTGLAGYLFRHADIHVANCKAFFSGGVTGAQGWGFILEGISPVDEGGIVLAGVSAQDNKADGYYVRNSDHWQIRGSASSNGTSGPVGTYVGLKVVSSTTGIADITCTERKGDGTNSWQQNALSIDAASTGNQIRISHSAAAAATVGTAIKSGSSTAGGNDISINGMGGQATDTFAASFTPDPYLATTHRMVLTGNVTAVNAPANAHQGCKLRLIFQQDATGGRTLPTFNAVYKMPTISNTGNTASKYWVAEFEYDGTNWVCTYIQQWAF